MDHERGEHVVPHGAVTEQSLPVSHTPGPWGAKRWSSTFAEFEIVAGKHEIALVYQSDGMDEPTELPSEANARLIAAAPDMLAVLEFVSTDPCFSVLGSVTRDEVRDAIAKATGKLSNDSSVTAPIENKDANLS